MNAGCYRTNAPPGGYMYGRKIILECASRRCSMWQSDSLCHELCKCNEDKLTHSATYIAIVLKLYSPQRIMPFGDKVASLFL